MDRITELMGRLAELSPEELTELHDLLQEQWAEARDGERTAETVAHLAALRDQIQSVNDENDRRIAAAADLDAEAERLIAEVEGIAQPVAETDPAEQPAEGDEPEPETPVEGEEPEPEAAAEVVEEQPEPVAAAVPPAPLPSIRNVATRRPASFAPRQRAGDDGTVAIVAAGDVPGFSAGSRIPDLESVGRAFADKAYSLMRSGGSAHIATFRAPTDGPLVAAGGNPAVNGAIIASALRQQREALTAAGGFCAPAAPLYNFAQISVADRPIRSALGRAPSDRGQVTWIPPARIGDASTGMVVWTLANDENPSSPATKPCVTIDCGTADTAHVDAIPLCVNVGNFDRMTFPEHFANFFEVAMAEHARLAERNLLDGINADATALTDGSLMGAAREVLSTLGRVAAVQRNVFRMARNAPVTVLAPMWLLAAMREDLTRQHPGDNAINQADATIEAYFRADNLNVTWLYEGRAGSGQDFNTQLAGALQGYPTVAEFFLFHPDAHFLLELPELNLGTEIRDTTTNDTNDVQAWLEIFEGVGFNGLWSNRLRLDVCFDGDSNAGNPYDCADVATGS